MAVTKTTALRLKRHLPVLRKLKSTKSKKIRNALLTPAVVKTICECAKNTLHYRIPLKSGEKRKLRQYKPHAMYLVNKNKSMRSKKNRLIQSGGFLSALLGPALTIIPEIIRGILGK